MKIKRKRRWFSSEASLAILATSILVLVACRPSYEERTQAREAERQQLIATTQENLKAFASRHGARPWQLPELGDENKLTAILQEEIEGKVVAFRAEIIDVIRQSDDDYILILRSRVVGRGIVLLKSTKTGVASVLAGDTNVDDEFLIAAEVSKIDPLVLELSPCDERDCGSVSLDFSMSGLSHRLSGRLVAIEPEPK